MNAVHALLARWAEDHAADLDRRGIRHLVDAGPTDRPKCAAWIDLDTGDRLLRVILWEGGEAVISAADATSDAEPREIQTWIADAPGLNRVMAEAVSFVCGGDE